jgi:hypothetical protein
VYSTNTDDSEISRPGGGVGSAKSQEALVPDSTPDAIEEKTLSKLAY